MSRKNTNRYDGGGGRNENGSGPSSSQKYGIGNMYYVRPQFPEANPEIPERMYTLRSCALSPDCMPMTNGNGYDNESLNDDQRRFTIHRKSARLSAFQSVPEGKVEQIEARQQIILNKLTHLKDMIETIHSKCLLDAEELSAVVAESQSESSSDSSDHLDIVINADPRKPPFSVIFMYKVLRQSFGYASIRFQTHIHSSATKLPEKYLNVFNELEDLSLPDAKEKLCIKLIWKNMSNGEVELLVDPSNRAPILGEPNIARFLSRLLPPYHSLNYDALDWQALAKVDGLLQLAKEGDSMAIIEHALLSQERTSPFLLNVVTIADFVLFSSVAYYFISVGNNLYNNSCTLRWLLDCQKYGGFELFLVCN